jgi:hypothetical protein
MADLDRTSDGNKRRSIAREVVQRDVQIDAPRPQRREAPRRRDRNRVDRHIAHPRDRPHGRPLAEHREDLGALVEGSLKGTIASRTYGNSFNR